MEKGQFNPIFISGLALVVVAILTIVTFTTDLITLSAFSDEATFTYTHHHDAKPLIISDALFAATPLKFKCNTHVASGYRYPLPKEECWSTTVTFGGKTHIFKGEDEIQLSDHLTVSMHPAGLVNFNDEMGIYTFKNPGSWQVYYKFKVAPGAIAVQPAENMQFFEYGQPAELAIKIDNHLGSFDSDNAGVWVKTKTDILNVDRELQDLSFDIKKGSEMYFIPINTSVYGEASIEIQAYAKIETDGTTTIRQESPITIKYEVVDEIPASPGELKTNCSFFKKLLNFFRFKGWSC